MNKQHCAGCRNNFYNGNNDLGVSECWNLKTAKLKTRYAIDWNAPMNIRQNYRKVRIPSCYTTPGVTAYVDEIPSYAVSAVKEQTQ